MKIVTFNIRCDYNQDGENSFAARKELILRCIRRERPDIIGFQETLPHVVRWLRENLGDYTVAGCGREAELDGEHMLLACRRDSLQLLGLSTFWLSPTPEQPGSRYADQSICPRCCCEALLREEETNRVFRIFVTHLDHETAYAREEGLRLILKQMGEATPTILLGDFNACPDAPELAPLRAHTALRDVTADSGPTFHNYGQAAEKIDYILATPEFLPESTKVWADCENGVFLSDHYPVEAVLRLLPTK